MNYDSTMDLEQTSCQVLLVFGERDVIIKVPENGSVPQAFMDDSRHVVTLEGCNHFPMLEKTAVFNRLLEDFIHSQEQVTIAPKDYWQRRTR
jgi:pimeloyl-ACP methyl ester carboxylesterase